MAADVDIANMALRHLGMAKEIANLETENSAEANACRRFFETTRKAVLRDFPWPLATKIASLALVEEDPNSEWAFSYRYPTDCLMFRRILSGIRNDNLQSKIRYRIGRDNSGRLIFTDEEDAVAEYTVLASDPNHYPADFMMAMSYRLAAYIAPSVTGADPFKLKKEMMDQYLVELELARVNAANEEQPDQEPDSEFIRARDVGLLSSRE